RPPGILCVAERDDARSTRKTRGWPQAHDAVVRAGYSKAPARVGPKGERREVAGDGDAGATARSAGRPCQVVRVQCLPAERADRGKTKCELVKVDLAEDDHSG